MDSIVNKFEYHFDRLDQFGNTHLIVEELEKEGLIDHEAWIEICDELEKKDMPYEALEALNVAERYFEDNLDNFDESEKEFFYQSKAENVYDLAINNEFDDFIFEYALNSFLKITKVIRDYDAHKIWGYIAEIQNLLNYEEKIIYKSLLNTCDEHGKLNIPEGIDLSNLINGWSGENSVTEVASLFIDNKKIIEALEFYIIGLQVGDSESRKKIISSMVFNLFMYGKNELKIPTDHLVPFEDIELPDDLIDILRIGQSEDINKFIETLNKFKDISNTFGKL